MVRGGDHLRAVAGFDGAFDGFGRLGNRRLLLLACRFDACGLIKKMLAAILGDGLCLELFIFGSVLLRVAHGPVDLLAAHVGGRGDGDGLRLAGIQILGRDVYNAIRVDRERDLNLRNAAGRSADTGELETPELLILPRHRALTLQDVHVDGGLEVGGGREDLALADGKGRVALNDPCAYAAKRLNAKRQRGHVQKEKALDASGEHAALQTRAHGDALVGVDALEGRRARDLADKLLHGGNAARAAHHEDLADLRDRNAGVVDGLINRRFCRLHKLAGEIVEFCPRERNVHMQRAGFGNCDIRKLNRGLRHGRKLDLRLFRRLTHALHGDRVAGEVDFILALKFRDKVVHDGLIEIVAAKVVVARRGENLDDARGNVQNRHVERAAAEVIDHDLLALLFVNAVGKRRRRGLVDDALNIQPRNFARILRGLPLRVGKIRGDGDDGLGDGLAEIAFRVALELLEDHRRDLLWRILVPVDVHAVVCAHLALDGGNGPVVVRDGLPLGKASDHPFTGLGEGDHRRRGSAALRVGNDDRLAAFHHSHAGIRGTKINPDDSGHT